MRPIVGSGVALRVERLERLIGDPSRKAEVVRLIGLMEKMEYDEAKAASAPYAMGGSNPRAEEGVDGHRARCCHKETRNTGHEMTCIDCGEVQGQVRVAETNYLPENKRNYGPPSDTSNDTRGGVSREVVIKVFREVMDMCRAFQLCEARGSVAGSVMVKMLGYREGRPQTQTQTKTPRLPKGDKWDTLVRASLVYAILENWAGPMKPLRVPVGEGKTETMYVSPSSPLRKQR